MMAQAWHRTLRVSIPTRLKSTDQVEALKSMEDNLKLFEVLSNRASLARMSGAAGLSAKNKEI